MILQEKKYRVTSLDAIRNLLKGKNIKEKNHVVSIHYYAQHEGNEIIKFVTYPDKSEIHILEEKEGRFVFKDHIPVEDSKAGFKWLKDKGYEVVDAVKMDYTEYEYKNGTVGLYIIDDFLYSVILYYPDGEHEIMEKELRLSGSEIISAPYNKYLEKMGRLRSMKLD